MRGRVAITGLGVVSPVGNSPDEVIGNLCAARSGIATASFDQVPVGVVDFDAAAHFTKMELVALDRFSQFAIVCANAALREARIEATDLSTVHCGVYFGSGMGGAGALDQGYEAYFRRGARWVPPMTVVNTMINAAAANLSIRLGVQGPVMTYAAACASSAIAIGEACRAIRDGYIDIAIAGGAEALLTPGIVAAWRAMKVLAPPDRERPETSCRPFSLDRSGLVLGEGAGVIVLERLEHARARGQQVLAELAGYGIASDARHITTPNADGQARALLAALTDADVAPRDVRYINAHGTATTRGDITETRAIRSAFGADAGQLAVSSTKALHGHLLGAAGAVELIATVMAMRKKAIPPTCHYRAPDPDCDLDYVPNVARASEIRCAMSSSFAFGGTNAVLVVAQS